MINFIYKTIKPLIHFPVTVNKFVKNSQAVAAVEFALIAPLLLLLFIGTVEVSLLVSVDRKISRTSSAIADLIAQQTDLRSSTGEAELQAIFGITERIMYPYSDRIPCVVITTVLAEAENDTNGDGVKNSDDVVIARVKGSVDNRTASSEYTSPPAAQCSKSSVGLGADENARQKRIIGDVFPLPAAINLHGTELVIAEVEFDHKPIIGFITTKAASGIEFDKASITLGDRIFLRPRKTMPQLPTS